MREIVPRTRQCGGQMASHAAGQAAYRRICRSTRLGRWRQREQGAQSRRGEAGAGHAAYAPVIELTQCRIVTIGSWRHRKTDIIAIRCTHRPWAEGRTKIRGDKRPVLRCQPDGIVIVAGVAAVAAYRESRVSRLCYDSVSTRKGSADEPVFCIRRSSGIWFPASAPRAATSRRRGETGGQHRPRSTVP